MWEMSMTFRKNNLAFLFLSLTLYIMPTYGSKHNSIFAEYIYGKTPKFYIQDNLARQDVSGSAWNGKSLMLAYDGGNNSQFSGVRIFPDSDITLDNVNKWAPSILINQSVMQRDIEGATFYNGTYITTSSMSVVDEESPGYRLLVEFVINDGDNRVHWERSVDIRNKLMKSLGEACSYPGWFPRVSNVFGKRGGLNVEGLSYVPEQKESVILGLRSPLCAPKFGLPAFDSSFSLREGDALLAKINKPFSATPKFEIIKLDLKGHGIRGLEYIKALNGYVIIGGPVQKADDYSLWLYKDDGKLQQLELNGFSELCRPESVTPAVIGGKAGMFVFSEEAGKACSDEPYTFIGVSFNL